MMSDLTRAVPIAQDLWWVGTEEIPYNLQCNSYLMINGDTGIVFEPGSAFSAGTVIEKVSSLIPIQNIEAIVCSHQDPDLCMGIGEFEKAGFRGVICCHERTAMIIRYYGFQSPFYLVNQHDYAYTMNSGLTFSFLFTPYLHFPGSIMVYLKEQKTLMSGDVFGSIGADWTLYAGSNYLDGMVAFHEAYMPSHRILSDAMRTIGRFDITMICPQHGSIINDSVGRYIEILRELPCGLFLEVKKRKPGAKGEVINAVNKVLTRLITIHGIQDVRSLFRGSGITIDAKKQRIKTSTFPEKTLWQTFFSLIEEKRGAGYLSPLAPFTERVSTEHELPLPSVFSSLLASSELEIIRGREALEAAQEKLHALQESLYLDPITRLYNQNFYEAYLKREVSEIREGCDSLMLLLLTIDNLDRINLDFGSAEGDRTMRTLGELISSVPMKEPQICRLSGGIFAIICHSLSKEEAIGLADMLRGAITQDERFIVKISVSMSLYHSEELPADQQYDIDDLVNIINQSALFRLRLAKKQGGGELVHSSTSKAGSRSAFTVLLIDRPGFDRDLIEKALEKNRFRVLTADDGLEGKEIAMESVPDAILCELLVSKLSGLTLRKELLTRSHVSSIPFILMSVNRNEQSIKRAYELSIRHFLKRPVALYEIIALMKLIMEKGE